MTQPAEPIPVFVPASPEAALSWAYSCGWGVEYGTALAYVLATTPAA